MKGVVVDVRATVVGERLRVGARVSTPAEGMVEALLPDREVAAFLPRSLLLGPGARAPRSLLGSLTPILRRFTIGREVRLWSYDESRYFSFPSWRNVRFCGDEEPPSVQPAVPLLHEDAKGDGHVQGGPASGHGDGDAAGATGGEGEGLGAEPELL
jgi:hypothetical protein